MKEVKVVPSVLYNQRPRLGREAEKYRLPLKMVRLLGCITLWKRAVVVPSVVHNCPGAPKAMEEKQPKLSITKSTLPEETKVLVLDYRGAS